LGAGSTVDNAGRIQATGPNSAAYLRGSDAAVVNRAGGEILAEGPGRGVWYDFSGSLHNAGRILGGTGVEFRDGGTATNLSGATLEGLTHGLVVVQGAASVFNAGAILGGNGHGVQFGGAGDATLVNAAGGTIAGTAGPVWLATT